MGAVCLCWGSSCQQEGSEGLRAQQEGPKGPRVQWFEQNILIERLGRTLLAWTLGPSDPRTLLSTYQNTPLKLVGPGPWLSGARETLHSAHTASTAVTTTTTRTRPPGRARRAAPRATRYSAAP